MRFSLGVIDTRHTVQIYKLLQITISKCLKVLKTCTEEFTGTINWVHTVIFSCKRKQIQMGRVGQPAACLDSTQKTGEEWCENCCEKRGRISSQTSALQGRKKCYFLRRNCVSPLSLRFASLSRRVAGIYFTVCLY